MINKLSDKSYWHGFEDFYETYFKGRTFKNIAEVGIYKGASIRWLLSRFPQSNIYAADIINRTDEWPVDDRFKDYRLDQGNVEQLQNFLTQAPYDLIIEDGSHHPDHQVLCLLEGIQVLEPNGIYILEDIHTSLDQPTGNALSVLLAIQHYRRLNIVIDRDIAWKIANGSLMSADDVVLLDQHIDTIELYRRTRLPDMCYKCNSIDFNYSKFKCKCGEHIFSSSDSMSFVIVKK
jgi:trans-aconitate methyltransferase